MCEKELPKRDEFGIGQSLLVPSIFVLDTFLPSQSQSRRVEMLGYILGFTY